MGERFLIVYDIRRGVYLFDQLGRVGGMGKMVRILEHNDLHLCLCFIWGVIDAFGGGVIEEEI